MTGDEAGADVRVQYRDAALVKLVVHAARGVDGVVRLQRRPLPALLRRRSDDSSAIELGRDAAGAVDVSVRLVTRLEPPPKDVVLAVAAAVRAQLDVVGENVGEVEITVTDVQR